MSDLVKVAELSELVPGKAKVVSVAGRELAIFNLDGRIYAIDNVCLHEGGPLGEGKVKGEIVTCPWHLWRYNIKTGELIDEPRLKVETYQVTVRGQEVLVSLPESRVAEEGRKIIEGMAAGRATSEIAAELGLSEQETLALAQRFRRAERLKWLAETYLLKGELRHIDLLKIPFRDLKPVTYGLLDSFNNLAELL